MGLGNTGTEELDAADQIKKKDKNGGCALKFGESSISCSICLEIVVDNGDRSWANLHCGHIFHLDCIGSAFNAKGAMQCPNCRKVEKGQWLYANGQGHRSLPDLNFEDWAHEEDLYESNYSEMSFGVHWCPFNSLARLHRPFPFDDLDFSPNTYPEIVGHHGVFPDHLTEPCPYVAYFGPIYHSSSSTSSANVSEASPFSVPNSYPFPSMDLHYHSPQFPHSNRADSSSASRTSRIGADTSRLGFLNPFPPRASSSTGSPITTPFLGSNARTRDRVQALQAYYQQQSGSSPPGRRAGAYRGMVPGSSSSSEQSGFYFMPGGSFPESESPARYRVWGREHMYPG